MPRIDKERNPAAHSQAHPAQAVAGTAERPRLAVFRSVAHIYAQVIDDRDGPHAGVGVVEGQGRSDRTAAMCRREGDRQAGGRARQGKGHQKVVFDRGGYLYHGRIKALADAAREAGLEF